VFTNIDCPNQSLAGRGAELTTAEDERCPARHRGRSRLTRLSTPARIATLTAALVLTGLSAGPAAAQYYYRYGYGGMYGHPARHRPSKQAAKVLNKEAAKDPFRDIPKGPLQIFVSIDQQKLHLYSDGVHVADTSVATGVPSLPTPLGVFSVIQKQVFHRSNLYSDAPMPFMQRITWSGVALHEGESIGHRASHGCIRMPHDFAVHLYHLTRLGVPVFVAERELKPVEIADPHLFVHRDQPPAPPAPMVADQATLGLRGSAVGTEGNAATANAMADAAAIDPAPGVQKTAAAAVAATAPVSDAPAATPAIAAADPAVAMPPADPAVPMPPAEPPALAKVAPASKAPIAIFISRREKKIYVRQDFAPLFQAPVTFADPDKPVGTLAFTALDFAGSDRTTLRWNVVVFPAEPPPQAKRKAEREMRDDRYGRPRRYVEEREKPDLSPPQTPAQALARITIPQAAIDYISQLIVPGSTLTVSDHGLGDETGEGTNFVVVLR
jgi:L,D-transpeptidase catalytic domain